MKVEDIVIVGSGPAAYSAALFVKEYNPILFEGTMIGSIGPGGQLTTTTNVDNYPGFPNGIQGPELMEMMKNQAIDSGVNIISQTVSKITKDNDIFTLLTEDNEKYFSKTVIIATGASAKRLYVPGTSDNEYWQKGISACAVCDGFFFKNKIVAVIGGGDAAMEETLYLTKIASKVYLIHRRNEFRARKDMLDKVKQAKNVEIITPSELISAHGNEVLTSIKLINNETQEISEIKLDGLFFGIGHVPNVWFVKDLLKFRENGYILADEKTRTSVPGIFACGDVQDYVFRQAITAASSGCIAGTECIKFLKTLKTHDEL